MTLASLICHSGPKFSPKETAHRRMEDTLRRQEASRARLAEDTGRDVAVSLHRVEARSEETDAADDIGSGMPSGGG